MLIRFDRIVQRIAKKVVHSSHVLARDVSNVMRYGPRAPLYAECIWINPAACSKSMTAYSRSDSGKVIRGAWPAQEERDLMALEKFQICFSHWVQGQSWEDAGAYDYMKRLIEERGPVDHCTTDADVRARYLALDKLFVQIKNQERLKTRKEINPRSFREQGGIYMHIGPQGVPYFGGGGFHRLAIARILEINCIPAQVGCIHISALDLLPAYRSAPERAVQNAESPA